MALPQPRIVIIGAGLSGLATAHELLQRLPDADVTVLEGQSQPGGMLRTIRKNDYLIESGPVSFPGYRLGMMKLCQKLGLCEKLIQPGPAFQQRFLLHHDGLIQPLPRQVRSALSSRLLTLGSAYRLLTERLRFSGATKNKLDESVFQFIERRVSTEVALFTADALCNEQFASDGRAISVRSGFPILARAEQQYGNVTKGYPRLLAEERLAAQKAGITLAAQGYQHYAFAQGMATLVQHLQAKLKQPILCGIGAASIVPAAQGLPQRWLVRCSDEVNRLADHVVLACPAYKQAALLADVNADLADALLGIPTVGLVKLTLGYEQGHLHPKSAGLFQSNSILIPQRYKKDILKIEFPSAWLPERAPAGHVMLQLTMGGWQRKEMITWEDDTLILAARRELRNLLKITKPPRFLHLERWPKSIPQYTLGHAQRVSKLEDLVRVHTGIHLGGNSLYGITMPEIAMHAERIARTIRDQVHSST